MLKNFHLVAITRTGPQTVLFHIPLHQGLQNTLAKEWTSQQETFLDKIDEVGFDAGYILADHERFKLDDYQPPQWLLNETSQTVSNLNSVSELNKHMENIKGIAAFAQDESGNELVLFQNFNRSHIIRPGRFLLLLEKGVYQSAARPGLTLDSKLAAILWPADRKLLFRNFRITNTFLPLAEFYEAASDQQIREVLDHDMFIAEDADALLVGVNQWFRKRFAMLRDSGILDQYTADQILEHSEGYEVDIQVDESKIIFPADKPSAKRLLQFLNEEIFHGAITETLYETNSKRKAD